MSWFEDKIAELQILKQREITLDTQAPALFEKLVKQIQNVVDEAKNKGFFRVLPEIDLRVLQPDQRRIHGIRTPDKEPRTLTISFDPEKKTVDAVGITKQRFAFKISDNYVVSLTEQGEEIALEAAVEKILIEYLFPELRGASKTV